MAGRLLLTAICVFALPLPAAADDYTRKDYRDSYERHYERAGKVLPQPGQRFIPPAQKNSAAYDEYSLYDWANRHNAEAPENIEPAGGDDSFFRIFDWPD